MMAPALPQISDHFGITSVTILNMTLTIFLLAYATGPLFLGPISEITGRRWVRISHGISSRLLLNYLKVLHISNISFLVFNLACAFAPSTGALIGFRFLG